MKKNQVLEIWKQNKVCLNGWLSIPNSFTAEGMSKIGWDSLTIDMQHGHHDYSTSIHLIQAISNNTIPLARVPWNEPGIIMKMLDLGILGIIAPMINTKKQCEDFVSYCNYPPLGNRSFGPMRAQLNHGMDYYENANKNIISMAMIETKEAVENVDEILSVPNLTGGTAVMNTNHHLTKPVLIGEIQADGQFDIVWSTSGGVIGDAWTDFLPDSARIVADWTSPIKCGNYNIDTGKCSGQNY